MVESTHRTFGELNMTYNEATRKRLHEYMRQNAIDPLLERVDLPNSSISSKSIPLKYSEQRHRQAHLKWRD